MLKRLGRDVAIYGAGEFLFKFMAFAVFPIYAHVFSLAEFGIWSLLTVSTGLLGLIMNVGVNQAVQRFYLDSGTAPEDEAKVVSTGLFQLLLSGMLMVGVAALILGSSSGWLEQGFGIDRWLLALALAAVIPDQIQQFCLDTLRLHFTPFRFIALSFAKNLVGTALSLWFVLGLAGGLHGLFAGALLGSLAALPLALWFIRRDLAWHFDTKLARRFLGFGYPLLFTAVAGWLYASLDRWMLVDLSSAEELGLFSVAAKYATVVLFMIVAFGQAWSPFAIRLMRDDPDHRAHYSRIFSLWFFVLAMAGLALALFSQEALMALTPPDYWAASGVLPFLSAGLVLYGTTLITALGLTLEKKTVFLGYGAWIAALCNFLLNLALIPRLGALGAAIATLLSYGILTSAFLLWSQRFFPLVLERGKLLYCCGLVAACLLPGLIGSGEPSLATIALKLLLLLLATAGAVAVGILDRSHLRLIRARGAE